MPQPSAARSDLADTPPGGDVSGGISINTTVLTCGVRSWPGPGGRVVVLRVVGEIDQFTLPTLLTALDTVLSGAVEEPTSRLVIDLAGVTYCSVQGFALLARKASEAATNSGYALSGCNPHLERCWQFLDSIRAGPGHNPVTRHVSTAAAVIAAHTEPPEYSP